MKPICEHDWTTSLPVPLPNELCVCVRPKQTYVCVWAPLPNPVRQIDSWGRNRGWCTMVSFSTHTSAFWITGHTCQVCVSFSQTVDLLRQNSFCENELTIPLPLPTRSIYVCVRSSLLLEQLPEDKLWTVCNGKFLDSHLHVQTEWELKWLYF